MPARAALTSDELQEAAILVVALKRSSTPAAGIVRALVARFGISESTARRLGGKPSSSPLAARFAALYQAAESREITDLHRLADHASAERALTEGAKGADPRPGTEAEQGRIVPLDPADAPEPELDRRSEREKITGQTDSDFEREQEETFARDDAARERRGYRKSELDFDITKPMPDVEQSLAGQSIHDITMRKIRSSGGILSPADLLTLAVYSG